MKPVTRPPPRRAELPPTPHRPAPYDGPSRDQALALRREYLTPALLTLYREPLCLVQGKMQYVWDDTGRRYLDAFGGIVTISVGHAHDTIVERIRDQVGKLCHTTTLYVHPAAGQYAKALADHFPDGSDLKVTTFTNSGSEANEVAVLTARVATGRFDVIALRNGYHGGMHATMGLTGQGTWKYPVPQGFGVHHVAPGYCYRCPFGLTYPSCDLRCAHDVAEQIRFGSPGEIACFIGEPIQGVGGVVDPPPEYFKIVYDIVRRHGGLCIADEVQTGWGRTGDHFWGFENYGVVPDIVTLAKGMANGAPLGACTTRPDVAQHMTQRLHFNTFAGNPVSMIQGLTTLEIIDAEGLQENARRVGGHLRDRLLELQERHPLIGDVRGKGLILGVELVDDRVPKSPATAATADVLEMTKTRGLLLGKGGYDGNVLRITPPMCITRADADFLADCLDEVLTELESRNP
ncbi:MAG: aspartate aminotransferase family protein [Phycisphaerales bacterium]|nr:aspartate aminotransferase family protein [Phycisphaerales bacterium]